MKSRPLIVALVAMSCSLFQSCDRTAATSTGDRSNEGTGSLAFRLSPSNLQTLRANGTIQSLQIRISGPGLDSPIVRNSSLDTNQKVLAGIPSGTRYLEVSALDSTGWASWTGRDTVEVHPNQSVTASVTLYRNALPNGSIMLDVNLVDSIPHDTSRASSLDLSQNTVFLDGQTMSVRTIQPPASWIKYSGQDATWGLRPNFVTDDSGALAFATSPVPLSSLNPDSIPIGFAGQVGSDRLPAVGAIGLHFKFFSDPGLDKGMERWIRLVDSTGVGMELKLGVPFQGDSSCTPLWQPPYFGGTLEKPSITTLVRPADPLTLVRNQTWWISWNADSICVRSESGIFRTIRTDGHFTRPVILLGMGDKTNGVSRVQIDKFRFYRP